ncbi:beta-glucuronidase-like isoform X2 [Ptychodera flava]|uniref:beta-glucuronidase-like isoform X2 n=1 Tax=Ptychodera flava TaxID=63121 RepID=UPI00396A81D5
MGTQKVMVLHAFVLSVLLFRGCGCAIQDGMLYPRDTETRETKDLSGVWNFRADKSRNRNAGFEEQWFKQSLFRSGGVIDMPVPSSYNDITQDKSLRDFVGWVWYDREFYPPYSWQNLKQRVVLRFQSAHYYTIVWLNGEEIMEHDGGHLPFEIEVTDNLVYGQSNRITAAVNNTLTPHTLPPGTIEYKTNTDKYPAGYFVQDLQMDFFNYAGIHRAVKLYTTPRVYIDDITVISDISASTGLVNYNIKVGGDVDGNDVICQVDLLDKDGKTVSSKKGLQDQLSVSKAHFWWPYTMSNDSAYLYTLKVSISSGGSSDLYRLPVGIRTVKTTNTQILINDKPFYCHGVAKHEDSDFRGKGVDLPLIAKDFNLLKWLGANCFRTSHYPYADEIMDMADRHGIVVIDECPGVGITHLENFSNKSLTHHLEVMEELVRRDKNRPSVIMWSVANEPASEFPQARHYFKSVISHTRSVDPSSRPVTFVCDHGYDSDIATEFCDVICLNSYYGWYSDTGHTEVIQLQLEYNLRQWFKKRNKPIIQTEYGAGSIAGIHLNPDMAFSEDYQVEVLQEHFKIFDKLRKEFLVGEMVWNFADFMTAQGTNRVVGNRKGVFTRQRQPKMAAYILREHYLSIINSTSQHSRQ